MGGVWRSSSRSQYNFKGRKYSQIFILLSHTRLRETREHPSHTSLQQSLGFLDPAQNTQAHGTSSLCCHGLFHISEIFHSTTEPFPRSKRNVSVGLSYGTKCTNELILPVQTKRSIAFTSVRNAKTKTAARLQNCWEVSWCFLLPKPYATAADSEDFF